MQARALVILFVVRVSTTASCSALDGRNVWLQPDAGSDSVPHALSHSLADSKVRRLRCDLRDCVDAHPGLCRCHRSLLRVQPDAGSERIAHGLAYALADAEVRWLICGCATSRALRDVRMCTIA